MKINANSIKAGFVLEHNGKLYMVSKTPEHTMPGKGGAFVQVEMKDLKTGTKLNERFRSNEAVTKAFLDQKDCQFLYLDDFINLMDNESFEQLHGAGDFFGDSRGGCQRCEDRPGGNNFRGEFQLHHHR